jgi:cytochrome c556
MDAKSHWQSRTHSQRLVTSAQTDPPAHWKRSEDAGAVPATGKENGMVRLAMAGVALALGMTAASAQTVDPAIGARKEVFKGFLAATRPVVPMLRREAPFDLAVVQAALKAYSEGAPKVKGLFPDTSKTGGETEALPAIWTDKAKFDGIFVKFEADAKAAAAAIKDEASFRANFPGVVGNCQTCHDSFRVKK